MSAPISFHTAEESVFQSAFLEVLAEEVAQSDGLEKSVFTTGGLGLQADSDEMQTLASLLDPRAKGAGDLFSTLGICVQHTLDLAKAKALGNDSEIERLNNILTASLCDALNWAKISTVAAGYYNLAGNKPVYRPPTHHDDFVYPLPPAPNDTLTVGLVADWGSGEQVAELLFEEMCIHKPQVIIHLGDVYYSGTAKEQEENFTNIVNRIREDHHPCALYNLPGNHDYYAGGAAFYNELSRLNQPPAAPVGTPQQEASFFCLTNDHWQIQGMDTGYYDHDYFKHAIDNAQRELLGIGAEHMTKVTNEELAWHHDKLKNKGNRRLIFLSHHQLFSAYTKIGKGYTNHHLLEQFDDALKNEEIAAWYWGHEHILQVYDPHLGLAKGRCIGHGAFPIFARENAYEVADHSIPLLAVPASSNQRTELQADDPDGVLEHGYVILKLRPFGQKSESIYYTIPGDGQGNGQDAISNEIFRELL